MKLRSLELSDFARITRARLELGDGLNVVYGRNDLGKSTLANAIRATLLLPTTSSAASEFMPWDRDAVPKAALTFETGEGAAKVVWRVTKTWGAGTRGTALLERSDDEGKTFGVEARSRAVDGQLREMLGWGIASPGGKNAPRGLPESFLTKALLGGQAESGELFAATLDTDSDEAGRASLTRALEAYAQDPVFKEILLRAQARVEEAFSASGRKRSGKASPFREPNEAVKEAQREHERAVEALERAERAVEEAGRLQEALARAMERRDEAERALSEAEASFAATAAHESAARAFEEAQSRVEAHEADARALEERRVAHAAAQVAEREAREAREGAAREAREAREAHTRAHEAWKTAQGSDSERELRESEAERAYAAAKQSLELLQARAERAAAAAAARAAAAKSATAAAQASEALEAAKHALDRERAEVAGLERLAQARERATIEAELVAHDEERAAIEAAARALQIEASALDAAKAEVASRATPSREVVEAARTLARELEVAEQSLDVGLSLALRRLGDVEIEASVDGEPVAAKERTLALDARRELRLKLETSAGPLVDLVIRGGAAEAHERVDALRARWDTEVAPLLTPLAVADADPGVFESGAGDVSPVRRDISRLEAAREAHDEADRALARREEALVRARQTLADRRERLGSRASLEARLAARPPVERSADDEALLMAPSPDGAVAGLRAPSAQKAFEARIGPEDLAPRRAAASQALAAAESAYEAARAEASDAREAAASDAAAARAIDLDAEPVDEAALEAARRAAASAERELQSTRAAGSGVVAAAKAAEERARAARDAAEVAEGHAAEREREALRALAEARAREEALAERLARVDRSALDRATRDARARLEAAPLPAAPVDESALEGARREAQERKRALDEAKETLDRFQGHLEQSGGAQAVEREREAKAALEIARAKEREIEDDYEGWKLLRDALRDAENAEGQHLGEALAPRVKARFTDLLEAAGGDVERYAALSLDAHLQTQGLMAFGEARGAEALSVGTREQLALLLRLSIAEVLRAPLVLDDHLTHTDRARSAWFRETLRAAAHETQLIVLTCHPDVYLDAAERPTERAWVDRAAGLLRAIDAERIVES